MTASHFPELSEKFSAGKVNTPDLTAVNSTIDGDLSAGYFSRQRISAIG